MSLLWMDGFDYYDQAPTKYLYGSNVGCSAVGQGVFGYGRYLGITGFNQERWVGLPDFTAVQTLIASHHLVLDTYPGGNNSAILTFMDGGVLGTMQCSVRVSGSGNIALYRGSTLLATSATTLNLSQAYWMSTKLTVDPTSGLFEVYINGSVFVTFSGNTRNTANSTCNNVHLGGVSGVLNVFCNKRLDNFFLMNTAGSVLNDHLPESRIYFGLPTGAGTVTQWTPSAGANWQCVDENPPNTDTDYNSSSTVDQIDQFVASGIGSGLPSGVLAVNQNYLARKDDAGVRETAAVLYRGGTTSVGTTDLLASTYLPYFTRIMEQDPITAAAWVAANIYSTEWGYKLVT